MEYQGQLWGGPEHGNVVSATVERFRCDQYTLLFLDGNHEEPSRTRTSGWYEWHDDQQRFNWDGPGADGDTLERLRL